MSKTHQEPLSVEKQIENLKAIGLIVENEDEAKNLLNDISYYRIIKAYSVGLKDEVTKHYLKGVSFNQIKQLYVFNAKFRYLLFPEIEKVEINLRCRLANYISLKYGVLGYKDPANFSNEKHHSEFLKEVDAEIKRNSRVPFVMNYLNNYAGGELPFYALVELLSFGSLSKFFKNMKNNDKKSVAKSYGINYVYLESWIEHLAFVRNVCAHYGRLYNCNLTKKPDLYKQYKEAGINNYRVYATLICLKHLIPNDEHWKKFVNKIDMLFTDHPFAEKRKMGFPDKDIWKKTLL